MITQADPRLVELGRLVNARLVRDGWNCKPLPLDGHMHLRWAGFCYWQLYCGVLVPIIWQWQCIEGATDFVREEGWHRRLFPPMRDNAQEALEVLLEYERRLVSELSLGDEMRTKGKAGRKED